MEFISGIRIRDILLDRDNWKRFYSSFADRIRPVILANVLKVLACRTPALGYHRWQCPLCGLVTTVPHSCKSRFCSSCGKKATDQWIQKNMAVLPKVPWQHITFTLPAELRPLFWLNRHLFNQLAPIPAGIITELAQAKGVLPGIFMAIHTFGREMNPNVHFHLSTTLGGLSLDLSSWIDRLYFHHAPVKKMWRYRVINCLRTLYKAGSLQLPKAMSHIQQYTQFNVWLNALYQKQWVVHLGKPCKDHKRNVEYLGRYLKRPPISETRIKAYDGESVTYTYVDHNDNKQYNKTVTVFDFIGRLIQHIPDRYFRLIRYYNWLSNRTRGKLLPFIYQLLQQTIVKTKPITWRELYIKTFNVDPLLCPQCQSPFILVAVCFSVAMKTMLRPYASGVTVKA